MIEKLLLEFEDKYNFFIIFTLTSFISILVGVFTFYSFNHPYVLVGLLALALSYPAIYHLVNAEKNLEKLKSSFNFLNFFRKEIMVYSSIFFGFTFGLFILFILGFVSDTSVFESIVGKVTGNFVFENTFLSIAFNNLTVSLLTFTLSILMFSGFLFVLSWNASILAYYLAYVASDKVLVLVAILPHLVLEISGFILAGLAGNVLMYGLEYKKGKYLFFYYSFVLLLLAFLLVILGAFLEVM